MNESVVLYQCPDCGYIVEVVNPGSPELICSGEAFAATCVEVAAGLECCGKKMIKLEPNTVEASQEKHLPVAEWLATGQVAVKVGEAAHPMTSEHWIRWIWAVADGQVQRVELEPEQSPEAVFNVKGAGEVALYAYCNLHGLWKTLLQH